MDLLYTFVLYLLLIYQDVEGALGYCYWPDGTQSSDKPCNPGSGVSMCCGPGYACLSNKMCGMTESASDVNATDPFWLVRGTCTDSTWSDDACPKFCISGQNGDPLHGGAKVEPCLYGTRDRYFCQNSQTQKLNIKAICFGSDNNFQAEAIPSTLTIMGVTLAPSSTMSTSTATSASSASSTTTSVPSPMKQPDYSVPVGVGVGVPLGIIAVATASYLFLRHRRSRRFRATGTPSSFDPLQDKGQYSVPVRSAGQPPELLTERYHPELAVGHNH